MQRVSYRATTIYSLPVELLTRIFILGAFDECPYQDSPFLLKTDQHSYPVPSSNFQLLASHVCQHWRQIALRTSSLWSTLYFREPSHLPRAQEFLARCSQSPRLLDILIDTVSQEDYIHGVTLYTEELHAIFKLITPFVPKWRSFHLKICDNECKGLARVYLGTCGPAPSLETLQLYHFEDFRTVHNLYIATYRPPVVVFANELPKLKNVSLIGVNLPWEKSPYLTNLHNLELALHSEHVRAPYEHWDRMIRGSPNLERLTIHYSGPRQSNGDPSLAWPSSKERIYNHSLQELCLADLDPDYLCLIMERLVLPGVKRLSMQLPDQDSTPFIDLITRSHSIEPFNTTTLSSTVPSSNTSALSSSPPPDEVDSLDNGESTSVPTNVHHSASSLLPPAPTTSQLSTVVLNGTHTSSSQVSPTPTLTAPLLETQLLCTPFPFIQKLETLTINALECSTVTWRTFLGLLRGVKTFEIDFAHAGQEFLSVIMEGMTGVLSSPDMGNNADHDADVEPDTSRIEKEPQGRDIPATRKEVLSPTDRPRGRLPLRKQIVHVPYLPNLHAFKISGLSGHQVSQLIAYRQGCVEEFRVRRWVVKWCERWKGVDPELDQLIKDGWRGRSPSTGKESWVKVEFTEPGPEEEEEDDGDDEVTESEEREGVPGPDENQGDDMEDDEDDEAFSSGGEGDD